MNDRAFAHYLGISPSCWCLTQAGRAFGSRLILRAFATFGHSDHRRGRECVACDLATALGQSTPLPPYRRLPPVALDKTTPLGIRRKAAAVLAASAPAAF